MTTVLPAGSHGTNFEPVELAQTKQLPADLLALSEKHYGDCNVGAYFAKIGMAQEEFRDGKLQIKKEELIKQRQQLNDIGTFLEKVNEQLKKSPKNDVDLTGENQLFDRLYTILPDERLKTQKLKRADAELLCHAFTRKSENHITPNIEELTTDMTHIIEDLDKILPILKDLLQSYTRLIERIQSKNGR
jgi:molecular chaperone GrpE (heat shock protein)